MANGAGDWEANQSEFANLLGVTPQRVGQFRREGMPSVTKGGGIKIPLGEAMRWLIERERSSAKPKGFTAARERKAAADAEMAELELAGIRGDLLTLATCEEQMVAICDDVRGRLMAVPGKWAPKLQGIDKVGDIQAVLRAAITDVLGGLAADG